VSNHGGRAMDSSLASLDALHDVVGEVKGEVTVFVDGGVRRGSDIAKALAIGADCILIGRAALYGLAAGGEVGVDRSLDILTTEFRKTMGYLGCRSIKELTPEAIAE